MYQIVTIFGATDHEKYVPPGQYVVMTSMSYLQYLCLQFPVGSVPTKKVDIIREVGQLLYSCVFLKTPREFAHEKGY